MHETKKGEQELLKSLNIEEFLNSKNTNLTNEEKQEIISRVRFWLSFSLPEVIKNSIKVVKS